MALWILITVDDINSRQDSFKEPDNVSTLNLKECGKIRITFFTISIDWWNSFCLLKRKMIKDSIFKTSLWTRKLLIVLVKDSRFEETSCSTSTEVNRTARYLVCVCVCLLFEYTSASFGRIKQSQSGSDNAMYRGSPPQWLSQVTNCQCVLLVWLYATQYTLDANKTHAFQQTVL